MRFLEFRLLLTRGLIAARDDSEFSWNILVRSLQILARNAEIFSMSIPSLQFSIDRFRHRTRTCFLSNVKVFAYFSCKNRPDGEEKKRKTIESKFSSMCINIRIYIFIFKSVECKFLKNINVVLIVSDTLWIFPLSSSLTARCNFILFKN